MRPGGYCFQFFTMTRAPLAQCDLIARACGDCGLRYMASLCVPKTCLYRKLDSAIMVMKSAEDGRRYNVAHVLNGAMDRSVLVERPMSPVCTENLIRIDCVTETPKRQRDDRALLPVVPENSIRQDSRGEGESDHHPMRCLRSYTCLEHL